MPRPRAPVPSIPNLGTCDRRDNARAIRDLDDQTATFRVGRDSVALTIQDWGGYIGQWDNRSWSEQGQYTGLKPGFIKRAPVAWLASHHHGPDGADQAYAYAYLYAYALDPPLGAASLTLPDNPKIRILAATVAREPAPAVPARPLYDTLVRDRPTAADDMER